MNDRLWTTKVVKENVGKLICVMKTKFLCLENFDFPAQQAALTVFIRNTFLAVGYNIRGSINYALFETCFQVNLSIRSDEGLTLDTSASLSLDCGNFILINSFDAKF